ELDQRVVVTEQEVRQRLRQPRLADARGAGEDERPTGTARVLQARTRAADGPRERLDGLVLADDALVQLLLHVEQAAGLLLAELADRDAGRLGQDLGDEVLVDDRDLVEVARLPGALALALGGDELLLLVAQAGGELEVLGVDRGLLAAAHVGDLLVELLE